jgi:2-oxoglutarate ferredoxin oxidoreductase subunit alpha
LGGYTEDGEEYKNVMDRLLVKWESAKNSVPKPVIDFTKSNDHAIVSIGSCDDAIREARDILGTKDLFINYLRVTAFPFSTEIEKFLAAHKRIFVVEQNRDGQLHKLLQIESNVKQETLESIRIYDGIPLYAQMIVDEIEERMKKSKT